MSTGKLIQYIAFGILGLVIMAYLIPVGLIVILANTTAQSMDHLSEQIEKTGLGEANKHYSRGDIAAGGNPKQLEQIYERLLELTALPGEAARNNALAHVGLVTFQSPPDLEISSSKSGAAFVPVSLDVSELNRAGVVMMSDSPVSWNLIGATSTQRAKLALEGRTPINVMNAPQGFIAGLKTSADGDRYANSPKSLETNPSSFCSSMKNWADFFDIPFSMVVLWKIELPIHGAEISITDWGFGSAHRAIKKLGDASILCSGANKSSQSSNTHGFK